MFCSHCSSQLMTVSGLLRHIRLNHASDPSIRFSCNLQGCKRTFRAFKTYRNHIYAYHGTGALDQLEESHLSDVSQVSNNLRIMYRKPLIKATLFNNYKVRGRFYWRLENYIEVQLSHI